MIMLNNNLHIFITAAETGSLTEAAKKLYISQPAVSQAVKKLEDELCVKLFIRNKRSSLILTDVGERILLLANQMQALENRLYQTAMEENELSGGVVRIAAVPIGTSIILPRILPIFRKQFPDVKVELLEGNPLEVKNMVLDYKADIGISTSPYLGLQHRVLTKDHMVSVNRDRAVSVDLRKVQTDLVLCRIARDSITEQLKNDSIDLSHAMIVDAASTQLNMVAQGNGIGVLSELMLSSIPNSLLIGKVKPGIEVEISLIAHDFNELSPAAEKMVDMILERRI